MVLVIKPTPQLWALLVLQDPFPPFPAEKRGFGDCSRPWMELPVHFFQPPSIHMGVNLRRRDICMSE